MIEQLFLQWAGEPCTACQPLPANGSDRVYVRMSGVGHRCIACINADVRENEAFITFARHFHGCGLAVPEVYAVSTDGTAYLQQDLGDTTLFSFLYDRRRQGLGLDATELQLYKRILADLAQLQTAGASLNFDKAYPRSQFDRQSMQWDLNYFKYYFVKLAGVQFDEQLLEDDFSTLIDYLDAEDRHYFMYRDFQSRNIMLLDGKPYYIDFQGGRRGAPQYDVASLLYSSKSDMPEAMRHELLQYYVGCISPSIISRGGNTEQFQQRFYGFVLIRILQALGAYGYRGYFERKEGFLKSIPKGLANLRQVLENHPLPVSTPHLDALLHAIIHSPMAAEPTVATTAERLTVTVCSFSYKKALPSDPSGNGGGHLFDCRALPNPGRYPQYRQYTGRDLPVIEFLKQYPEVDQFLDNAQHIVNQSVACYTQRHFAHLLVGFGCTGGQHRSVYCAEQMAARLRAENSCNVVVKHCVIDDK